MWIDTSGLLISIQTFVALAPEKRGTPDDADFWQTYHQLACTELDRIRDLVSTMSRVPPSAPP